MSARHMRRVPRLESLERRTVLDASGVSLVDGVLTIEGTNKNDRVLVALAGELGDQLTVQFNWDSPYNFTLAEVTSISVNGNGGNDRVTIGEGVLLPTWMDGGRGNDWLRGGGGADEIHAGWGNDHVYGGGGDDKLWADAGNDKMWGCAGNDEMHGDAGHDWLRGNDGDDTLFGEDGFDHLHGGVGVDYAWGGKGKDHLHGDEGDDFLYGEDDKDHLYGGDGNDWLEGGAGWDHLWGCLGDDSLKGGWGNDHLNGGLGVNLLDGDEGFNHLWNGTEYDFENPPPPENPPENPPEDPPDAPGDEVHVTYLTAMDGSSATLTYTKRLLADGTFEEILDITVDNHPACTCDVLLDGMWLGFMDVGVTGHAQVKFSTVPDQSDELPFPEGLVLYHGMFINVGPELVGTLNLQT